MFSISDIVFEVFTVLLEHKLMTTTLVTLTKSHISANVWNEWNFINLHKIWRLVMSLNMTTGCHICSARLSGPNSSCSAKRLHVLRMRASSAFCRLILTDVFDSNRGMWPVHRFPTWNITLELEGRGLQAWRTKRWDMTFSNPKE